MTKNTFTIKNNNNTATFCNPCYKCTDYSALLDNLIAADIADKNPWLYGNSKKIDICTSYPKIKINIKKNPSEDIFAWGNKNYSYNTAFNFLANINNSGIFEKGIKYKLSTGDYITITDDYIHINDQIFFFNLMDDAFFYNLNDSMKKTIATIYIAGLKITIKK